MNTAINIFKTYDKKRSEQEKAKGEVWHYKWHMIVEKGRWKKVTKGQMDAAPKPPTEFPKDD